MGECGMIVVCSDTNRVGCNGRKSLCVEGRGVPACLQSLAWLVFSASGCLSDHMNLFDLQS